MLEPIDPTSFPLELTVIEHALTEYRNNEVNRVEVPDHVAVADALLERLQLLYALDEQEIARLVTVLQSATQEQVYPQLGELRP